MASSLDIVRVIESTKITKLSNTYNNVLLNKIKEKFTDLEQQLFVSSFYCYLNNHQTNDFVIDLDNIWQWLGFSQKYHSKVSLEKHFKIDIDYKILHQQLREQVSHGGHNKETIMLNIKTFKLFCIKAATKKASEIHEYFVKLEELLLSTIHEQTDELTLQLEEAKEELQTKSIKNIALEREKILLREYESCGSLVYIIKVKSFENGEYIIKIGESRRGVGLRYAEHKSKYEEVLLLDCFLCKNSKDFESFLHNHEKIKKNKIRSLKGHENENELFLIGRELTYKMVTDIIDKNIKNYIDFDVDKIYYELQEIKQHILSPPQTTSSIESDNPLLQELINMNKRLLCKVDEMSNKVDKLEKSNEKLEKTNTEILEKLNGLQTKTTNNFGQPLQNLGPRLQKINAETLNLVKVYESVSECLKETNNLLKRPSIEKAIKENTVYRGFRWQYVDRTLNENEIHNLQPTRKTQPQNGGYLAKLNKEKTEIIAVYIDRKTACFENGHTSPSALDIPVKNSKITNNHYYILYDDCPEDIKEKFIDEKNQGNEPVLYKDGVGQYDKDNNELIMEFVCKNNCSKNLGISDKSLTKALDQNMPYNGHYFRRLGEKLVIQ